MYFALPVSILLYLKKGTRLMFIDSSIEYFHGRAHVVVDRRYKQVVRIIVSKGNIYHLATSVRTEQCKDGSAEPSRRFATTPSSPLDRTAAISSDGEASNVSEKRIVSGNFEITSRSISRRAARRLRRKPAPASTGASKA
jgi:hypothetical protein